MTIDAAGLVDARGMRCPWPALRLARAMRANKSAEMISDDPRAADEARALADQQGWQLQIAQESEFLRILATRA